MGQMFGNLVHPNSAIQQDGGPAQVVGQKAALDVANKALPSVIAANAPMATYDNGILNFAPARPVSAPKIVTPTLDQATTEASGEKGAITPALTKKGVLLQLLRSGIQGGSDAVAAGALNAHPGQSGFGIGFQAADEAPRRRLLDDQQLAAQKAEQGLKQAQADNLTTTVDVVDPNTNRLFRIPRSQATQLLKTTISESGKNSRSDNSTNSKESIAADQNRTALLKAGFVQDANAPGGVRAATDQERSAIQNANLGKIGSQANLNDAKAANTQEQTKYVGYKAFSERTKANAASKSADASQQNADTNVAKYKGDYLGQDASGGEINGGVGAKFTNNAPAQLENRASLGQNVQHNVDKLDAIFKRRPDLIGVINGRISNGQTLLGTNDADLSAANDILENTALASVGMHGSRSQKLVDEKKTALLNSFKNGPDAVAAAFAAEHDSAQNFIDQLATRKPKSSTTTTTPTTAKPVVKLHPDGTITVH